MCINKLPFKDRFKKLILPAMCITMKEPNSDFMNLYMKSFVNQITKINENDIIIAYEGKDIKIILLPLCSSVDSVARPLLQNRIQFNGYDDCSWCYVHGKYINGSMRYSITENERNIRSHVSHLNNVQEVLSVNPSKCFNKSDRKNIDNRLILIKLPNEIHRLPGILQDKNKWKGTEWRSWLLYYSFPCLKGILNAHLLELYMLLI
ncbi:hypothetical protein ALC57_01996 [Trachymyrmex cornetzi]|uniref:Uncharacterized protein n=1 Tax=Trachymyrmex cornetzi TaxID=471704 RepID=A0A151JPR9_9HYME|nr:hypothetical protein ALC57_01996 [Trachymyrmex cornetzi]